MISIQINYIKQYYVLHNIMIKTIPLKNQSKSINHENQTISCLFIRNNAFDASSELS